MSENSEIYDIFNPEDNIIRLKSSLESRTKSKNLCVNKEELSQGFHRTKSRKVLAEYKSPTPNYLPIIEETEKPFIREKIKPRETIINDYDTIHERLTQKHKNNYWKPPHH